MIGQQLLQYRIVDKLGAGGMGVVWLAVDTKLGREVALKVLSGRTRDPDGEQRFLREARAASALNHPNIITIYEINTDRGETFIAMEYVRGRQLHQIMRERRLAIPEAAGYAVQIGEALNQAHAAGIVHRDLKPGNIMVTNDGLVKVLDFGLAKVAGTRPPSTGGDDDATGTSPLTAPGVALGTPGHMSPEQAIGDFVDARSDIFSFGIILYEMFTGDRPFMGETPLDRLRAILTEDVGSQDAFHIAEPWRSIVLKCLNKKRQDRYQTAAAVVTDLRSALQTTAPAPASIPDQRGKTDREKGGRRYGTVTIAAAVTGLAILAAGGLWWYREQPRGVPSGQRSPIPAGTSGSAFDLTRLSRAALQRYDKTDNISSAIGMLEEAIAKNRGYAPAYAALGEAYLRKNAISPDPEWLKRASQYGQKAIDLNPDLAVSHVSLGMVLQQNGRRNDAEVEFRKAADLDPKSAPAFVGLAKAAAGDGRKPEAERLFQAAVQADPSGWIPRAEYGIFQYTSGRYAEAAQSFERARELTPDNVVVHRNLGATYSKLDRNDDAASEFQRALEIQPSGTVYTNLGTIRFYQGRYLDAIPPMEKAVQLLANRYRNWGNLADAYRMAPGYRDKAKDAYQRAIQLARAESAKAPDDAEIHGSLAVYLAHIGDSHEARQEIAAVGRSGNHTPGSLFKAALASEACGDRTDALRFLGSAISAGYSLKDVQSDPDLVRMREDIRYHRLISKAESARRSRN